MERMAVALKAALYSDIKARNRPSFYATPIAWAAANFVQSLIEDGGAIVPHHTGLIVASDECSLATIRDLSLTAAQGMVSPLRFAGASPSIVAGLPALQQGIRGPTIALTMKPEHASNAMMAIIDHWTRHCKIVSVIAIAHYRQGDGRHLFKGLLIGSASGTTRQDILQLCDPQAEQAASLRPDLSDGPALAVQQSGRGIVP